ncbi:beta-ketoacyl synthase N-terminal-like domain-containing protein [Desulfosediminicola sp.]|uniref:beta-ketoacyl synthase N-terminal-like domain-containing protein n=1 Tax=Desulfosediminicola sp. TaxID=2886825 RepID=UPI003AF1ED41
MSDEISPIELIADEAFAAANTFLGGLPSRWGRMTPLSRLLIVECGRQLFGSNVLEPGQRLCDLGRNVGLIGGTRWGSLHTDQAFIETMSAGPGLASPALFGYTLPNTPLAEVAVMFGLTGPVYALFDIETPLVCATDEARMLLAMQNDLDFMLACEFDHRIVCDDGDQREEIFATLTLVQ